MEVDIMEVDVMEDKTMNQDDILKKLDEALEDFSLITMAEHEPQDILKMLNCRFSDEYFFECAEEFVEDRFDKMETLLGLMEAERLNRKHDDMHKCDNLLKLIFEVYRWINSSKMTDERRGVWNQWITLTCEELNNGLKDYRNFENQEN